VGIAGSPGEDRFVGKFVGTTARPQLVAGQVLERIGGDDGTRTRGLCRDSETALGLSRTYKLMKTAQVLENHAEF
jgi:hypothetical protein